jgi:hypothetical protein
MMCARCPDVAVDRYPAGHRNTPAGWVQAFVWLCETCAMDFRRVEDETRQERAREWWAS